MKTTKRTMRIPRRLYREVPIEVGERQSEEDGGGYPVSFSSEEPILRWSWDGYYYEVLSHKAEDIDLARAEVGLPALKSHDRKEHFGSVTGISLDVAERKLRGLLGFSSIPLGVEQKTMVDEGHLRTVSVGYEILALELVEDAVGEYPTYRCRWGPLEVSLTPVPADMTVGVGRAVEGARVEDANLAEFEVDAPATGGEERMLTEEEKKAAAAKAEAARAEAARAAEEVVALVSTPRDVAKDNGEIAEMCAAHGFGDRTAEFILEGRSPDEVRSFILSAIRTKGTSQPAAEEIDVMSAADAGRYSYRRAIRINAKMEKANGLEFEVHQQLEAHRSCADHGGILVPFRTRALGTGEPTGGATLVGETVMPELIDYLRNKAKVFLAGARLYTGLVGVVQFNKKTGVPTVHWMAENPAAGVTQSEPAYAYVTMSPHTMMGEVRIPRQLLITSEFDVEGDIKADLGLGHGLAFDLAFLHGTGTANGPVGIYNAPDVQAHAVGGVPDLADIGTMTALLADANADVGTQSWMTTPLMAGLLRRTQVVSGQAVFLWSGTIQEGEMDGYPARATNQVSKALGAGADEHGLIFGNWNDAMGGLWGNDLELVVDPYTRKSEGQIEITSYSMGDTAFRRGESFIKGTGAKLA